MIETRSSALIGGSIVWAEQWRNHLTRDAGEAQRAEDDAYRHIAAQRIGIAIDDVRHEANRRVLVQCDQRRHERQPIGDLGNPGVAYDRPREQPAATTHLDPAHPAGAAIATRRLRVPDPSAADRAARHHEPT